MKIRSEAVWITAAVLVCLAATEIRQVWAQNRPEPNGWVIRESRSADKAHFGIDRSREGNHSTWMMDMDWASFRGLDAARLRQLDGKHSFEVARDAGRFLCAGVFTGGRGTGSYRFEPNPNFVNELVKLGYLSPSSDDLFTMALSDVTLEFARAVKSAGLNATTRDLLELRTHGVNADDIRETQALGFTKLAARDYVEMKIHGVQTEFMRDLKAAGYDVPVREIVEMRIHGVDSRYMRDLARYGLKPNPRDLVEMRIHGVTPDFLKSITEAGYDHLGVREVVDMRIHGVDSKYLAEIGRYGLKPTSRELVELRNHGVTPEYLKAVQDAGYGKLDVREAIEMRTHGVQPDFLRDSKALGYQFTKREVIDMRVHGVDSGYLRKLKDSGFQNLSADKIIRLHTHGVD